MGNVEAASWLCGGCFEGGEQRMGDAEAASRAEAAAGMRVFSPEYYALCAGGGMLAAGATHLAITRLDVFKVNMQGN